MTSELERIDPLADPHSYTAARRRHALASMPPCNIVVIGKTGVGKSTLLNAVFGADLATTGVGRPVTQHLAEHRTEGVPVTIVDTRGIELTDAVVVLKDEFDREIDRRLARSPDDALHVLWYCVSTESARFEPQAEGELIRHLARRLPTIVVLTRTLEPEGEEAVALREEIARHDLPVRAVLPVLALERRIGPVTIPAHGLEELVSLTQGLLPEAFRLAFVNGQVVAIDQKLATAFARIDEVAETVDTRYDALAFLKQRIPGRGKGDDVMLTRVLTTVGDTAAVFGPLAVSEVTIRALATAAVGERGGEAAIETLLKLLNRILVVIPPVGPTLAGRVGGKLAAAVIAAGLANHQDVQARKRAALLTRIIGRATARTFADAARAELAGAPLDADAIRTRFAAYIDDEATRTYET